MATAAPVLLLVDDTRSIRQLLLHALSAAVPWELVAVNDGTAALAVLAARPVPLMIVDYHLPDLRGDALAAAVKAQSPSTKVLLVTADIDLDPAEPMPHVDGCLIKPFPLRDLVQAVQRVLGAAA